MIETLPTDPMLVFVLGLSIGVWTPDKYTNKCVKQLAATVITTLTNQTPEQATEEAFEGEIPVEDAADDENEQGT